MCKEAATRSLRKVQDNPTGVMLGKSGTLVDRYGKPVELKKF